MGSATYTIKMVSTSHYYLKTASLGSVQCKKGKQGVNSKDSGGCEGPLIAQVPLTGQAAALSS